jgi:hypothetical protein
MSTLVMFAAAVLGSMVEEFCDQIFTVISTSMYLTSRVLDSSFAVARRGIMGYRLGG